MYVIRGEFLNFHEKPQYDSKTLPIYKLMSLTSPGSTFGALKEQLEEKGAIMLYESPSYLGHEVINGTVLFLKAPLEDKERIDKLLCDKEYAKQLDSKIHSNTKYLRDLYINWEKEKNEFRSFWARMTSINEEFSKPTFIALDELIGSGKIALKDDFEIAKQKFQSQPLEARSFIMNGFFIIRLKLIRRKHFFKEYWDWSFGTEYIQKE